MVATRIALLSLAAVSSCMFGAHRGGPRIGRLDRRLPQSTAASRQDAVAPPLETAAPTTRPPKDALSPIQMTESGSTWLDYPYPPEFAEGEVSTGFAPLPSSRRGPSFAKVSSVSESSSIKPPSADPPAMSAAGVVGKGAGESSTPIFVPTVTRGPPPLNLGRFSSDTTSTSSSSSDTTPAGPSATTAASAPSGASPDAFPSASAGAPTGPSATTTTTAGPPPYEGPVTSGKAEPTPPPMDGPGSNATTGAAPLPKTSGADGWVTMSDASSVSFCQPTDSAKPDISYSIIYTSTITWTGDPTNYTPPFPPDTTPATCVDSKTPYQMTLSRCSYSSEYVTCQTFTTSQTTTTNIPFFGTPRPKMTTVIVTAHNPTVVFASPGSTPDFGGPPTRAPNPHGDPTVAGASPSPPVFGGGGDDHPAPKSLIESPHTVAVQPGGVVVVDGSTFRDDAGSPTRVVTAGGGNTFIINPSQVIGGGATVDRQGALGGVFVPTPTSTNLGGLSVVVSSDVAVVDGTTFSIPLTASSAVVRGQTVSLGPDGVAVASQTVRVTAAPLPTEVVIAGGDVLTLVGQSVVVIQGTTITYGPGSSTVTDVDGDAVTIGPVGVTIHGTVVGGPSAHMSDTQFEIVGGATITEIGASVVVIAGHTYTVGPGAPSTSIVVGGETITIGPDGVSIATQTFPYPFGPTTTITPGASPTDGAAAATTSAKDAASSARPDWFVSLFVTCIAICVRVSGFLF